MQVGIIGLGRQWRQRYQPALRALRERIQIRCVCDQVEETALRTARRLGCASALGPTELLENSDVEAVLLLDPQWYGLWALEQACRAGKPVFCTSDLLPREPRLDDLRRRVQECRLPVLVALGPRHDPATADLLYFLGEGRVGPARALLCEFFQPPEPSPDLDPALLDWCVQVLGVEPESVLATGSAAGPLTSVLLEAPGERRAQLVGWRAPAAWHPPRLQVNAERGWATVTLPGRFRWTDATDSGSWTHRGVSVERRLLEQFVQALEEGRPPQPDLEEASRALRWLRAAERSRSEGRRVPVAE